MKRGNSLWLLLLLFAGILGGVGWWADFSLRRTIQNELRTGLQSDLDANVTALEIWMNNQKRIAADKAEEPRINAIALELFDRAAATTNANLRPGDPARQLLANDPVAERLRLLGYDTAQLVDTNFNIVADTGRGRGRGRPVGPVPAELRPRYEEMFARGEAVLITPFKVRPFQGFQGQRRGNLRGSDRPARSNQPPAGVPPSFRWPTNREPPRIRDQTSMQVAAPVKDARGQTRGALALIMSPDAEFTRILSVAKTGDSGETFAFDAEGLMISRSRFDDELKQLKLLEDGPESTSALTLTLRDPGGDLTQGHVLQTNAAMPLITMVQRAIEGEAGVELTPFRDYRGVPVVGAWRWLPEYGFGVGTKIDTREAFQSLRVVRRVFLILILMLVAAALVILVFTYKQLIWRRRLSEAELKARQLGQYKISEKIGEGGMGVVYKAHHSLLRRETALKLLLPEKADPNAIERFEQEVQLTCRLTHPNTIQVYDYGHTPDGIFYYAMEYLDGLNLHQLVQHYGAQPEERVLHILRQICDSLSEAHEIGLIHRDIKPANIFVSDRGGVPDSVKVLDFGLVRRVGGNANGSTEIAGPDGIVGTPNFIAPETIKDPNAADARSDVLARVLGISCSPAGKFSRAIPFRSCAGSISRKLRCRPASVPESVSNPSSRRSSCNASRRSRRPARRPPACWPRRWQRAPARVIGLQNDARPGGRRTAKTLPPARPRWISRPPRKR
jgi:hypothetical protein